MDNQRVEEAVEATEEELAGEVRRSAQISHVRSAKYDRMLKYFLKRQPKRMTAKEVAKMEKVNRGMEKIYALIDRGIKNVATK